MSDGYTLIREKHSILGMRYELHDPGGTLVTSITLGTSADAFQWGQVMGSGRALPVPAHWYCEDIELGAQRPGGWHDWACALAWAML